MHNPSAILDTYVGMMTLRSTNGVATSLDLADISLRAKLFRGFSDGSRLSILQTLRQGPLTVGEIAAATSLSQPNTSNHLTCLKECGLVNRTQRGRNVYYALSSPQIATLLASADELLAGIGDLICRCERYR